MTEGSPTLSGAGPAPHAIHAPPPDADALLVGQTRIVSRALVWAVLGLLANAVVLVWALWGQAPPERLLGWLGVIALMMLARLGLHLGNRPNLTTADAARRWVRSFRVGVLLSGLAWGSAALLFPTEPFTYPVFIAFLTGGLSAGVVAAYAAIPWLPHLFVVPATGLLTLALILRMDEMSLTMAAMVALFTAMLLTMTRNMHVTLREHLRLRQQTAGLEQWLDEAATGAERLNQALSDQLQEREQTETALRESEERFRALVENATDGIGFTLEGRIHYANQAALNLIGYSAEEVLGQPIEQFLATTTFRRDQIYQRYLDRISGENVPRQYETQMRRKDGTAVDVIFSNSVVHLNGQLGVMSIVKDITDRKRAEEELRLAKEQAEEATRLKDRFVSLLAHDLRAPLNSIFGLLTVLQRDAQDDLSPEQMRILRSLSEQGEATMRMIEDLLSVSRLHTGKLKPELRFVDAASLSANAVSLLRPLATEKLVAVLDEVPLSTRLYTDPEMFGKVLYNLLSNAIKFCRPEDRIRLQVPTGRPTTVAVADSGPGVEPSLLADLFRHDVKTSTRGSAGERGTGLGLPLSQELMHALGGEITVESEPGAGAVFYASLPPVRPKVLVVGRDESLALFVRPQLERIDADCLHALNTEEAVHKVESEEVHLVVCESELSGNGGMELLQRIRQAPRGRQVPLLVIADHAEAGMMEHGFRMGADEIVVKPLVPDDFLVRVRRFIN